MSDFRYHGVGLLVSLRPLTDRAREFCDARWPKGAPNACRNTEGGQLLGSEDFESALVAIADAGMTAGWIKTGNGYYEMEAANRAAAEPRYEIYRVQNGVTVATVPSSQVVEKIRELDGADGRGAFAYELVYDEREAA
jgi:hypothetical protein